MPEAAGDATVGQELETRLRRGGRLRPTAAFDRSSPAEPTDVAISVLLEKTDSWDELLAAASPSMRKRIAARVAELYRDGLLEIVGGEEDQP